MRPLRNGGVAEFLEIGSGQASCMQKSHAPVHTNNDYRQTTRLIRVHRLRWKFEGLRRTEEDVRKMSHRSYHSIGLGEVGTSQSCRSVEFLFVGLTGVVGFLTSILAGIFSQGIPSFNNGGACTASQIDPPLLGTAGR
jgi:hypothetical protein